MNQIYGVQLEQHMEEMIDKKLAAFKAELDNKPPQVEKAAIIASKGSLDMAYPPLILATAAATMDIETTIFFTFYGLDIVNKKKNKNLKVPPLGNPAMPLPVPNIIGAIPGMTHVATAMMNKWMSREKVMSIPELIEACVDADVKMVACQMTMDVMGVKREELIDEVEVAGAAYFIGAATESKFTLFV